MGTPCTCSCTTTSYALHEVKPILTNCVAVFLLPRCVVQLEVMVTASTTFIILAGHRAGVGGLVSTITIVRTITSSKTLVKYDIIYMAILKLCLDNTGVKGMHIIVPRKFLPAAAYKPHRCLSTNIGYLPNTIMEITQNTESSLFLKICNYVKCV
jgi:hypothetical protein